MPRGGPRCLYTLHAVREGRPASLAAWRVVAIEPPPRTAPRFSRPSDRQAGTFASTASQNSAAMSGPPKRFTSRMPVGDVTLISVR